MTGMKESSCDTQINKSFSGLLSFANISSARVYHTRNFTSSGCKKTYPIAFSTTVPGLSPLKLQVIHLVVFFCILKGILFCRDTEQYLRK